MESFNIKNPKDWHNLSADEILEIPCPSGSRKVRMTVNSISAVSVYVSDNPEMENRVLVGRSEGMFDVEYSSTTATYLQFSMRGKSSLYVKSHVGNQVFHAVSDIKFTTVEPRTRRNSDMDRMMQFVKMNEERRDAQTRQERQEMRRELRREVRLEREELERNMVLDPVDEKLGKEENETPSPDTPAAVSESS